MLERARKQAIWDAFCDAHDVAQGGTPLFETDEAGNVEVFAHGRDGRPMLRRSAEMAKLLANTVEQVLASSSGADGVLYLMHRIDTDGRVVPLYIGKAGRYGRSGGVWANLLAIHRDTGEFARWGYNYAYHLGDLSAATLPGHLPSKTVPKYRRWAKSLFDAAPAASAPPASALLVHRLGPAVKERLDGVW